MSEFVRQGQVVRIRAALWDGAQMLTGKTVNVSIERVSDGFFWNGSAFPDSTYRTVAMAELSGNVHVEGVYEYAFTTPNAIETYDWNVKFVDGSLLTYFKGSILVNDVEVNSIADDAIGASQLAADAIGASQIATDAVAEIQSGLATSAQVLNNTGLILPMSADVGRIESVVSPVQSLVDVGGNPTFTTFLSEATDDHYKDQVVVFLSGSLAGQARRIAAYNGTTKAITVDPAFTDTPTNFAVFAITPTAYLKLPDNFADLAITSGDGKVTATGAGTNVTLGAIQVASDGGNRTTPPIPLEMFVTEKKTFSLTILDTNGDPVDLTSRTLRFVVHDANDPPNFQFKIEEGAELTKTGANNEVANVTVLETQSTTIAENWRWELWDTGADEVLSHGSFTIRPAKKDSP